MRDRLRRCLQDRLDRRAIHQLRDEVVRLAQENDDLRAQLASAENCAESWRDDAMRLSDALHQQGGRVGLTKQGALVPISGEARHA